MHAIILSCLVFGQSYAQNQSAPETPKNVIHASLGTFIYVSSAQISYDRLIAENKDLFFTKYYGSIKAGGNLGLFFSEFNGGTGTIASLGATLLTGKSNAHFELGLGLGYFIDTVRSDDFVDDGEAVYNTFFPSISIGYRYQTTKGFMFRTGIGIAEWAYVGVGYGF